MESIQLSNGMTMPLIGLGTWDLNGQECVKMVKTALQLGYRLVDTAQMYGNEQAVGEGIRQSGIPRSEIFVTTKIYRPSASYEKARAAIDVSLARLGLTYVDLLLLHEPYQAGPQMYRALEEAYAQGKVRAIGISNYDENWYRTFLKQCTIKPMVNQLETHIFYQRANFQREMAAEGTMLQAWAPLAQAKTNLTTHPVLVRIGQAHGKRAAQVALRFLVQRGISVIPKTRHESRLKENLALFDFTLNDAEMQSIEALDQAKTFFPWTLAF